MVYITHEARSSESSSSFPFMSYTYEYFRPMLTTDVVVFGFDGRDLQVLLHRRAIEPCLGALALPGGFVGETETVEECALRKLREKAGGASLYLEQLHTFDGLNRDPRGRVISVAYYALVAMADYAVHAPTPTSEDPRAPGAVAWYPVAGLPELAFDHAAIIQYALLQLRARVRVQPIGFGLLADTFTLAELQRLYEAVLGTPLDKRNFRKRLTEMPLLVDTGADRRGGAGRPARLYRFDPVAYTRAQATGFLFSV